MAFEAYLQQAEARPGGGRRVTYVVSAVVHAVALLAAVGYSFWRVEEVTPPSVTVTFISAASVPPPPPPPPPLGGGASAPKHKAVARPRVEPTPKPTEIVQPKQPEIVQPKEEPKEQPKEDRKDEPQNGPKDPAPATAATGPGAGSADGVAGGVPGGVKGGTVGGTPGGTVGGTGTTPGPVASKFLPPHMGAQQRIFSPAADFPTHLAKAGAKYSLLAKVCVTTSGTVESVTLLKRSEPTLDANVLAMLKKWKFRPVTANGKAVPFCYVQPVEFKSE